MDCNKNKIIVLHGCNDWDNKVRYSYCSCVSTLITRQNVKMILKFVI